MIEITILGTGTGIPTPKRNHAAIYLRHDDNYMLFDCGEGTQRQIFKARLNFMRIDRIFITHWHADHWAGLIGLMQTMNLEKRQRPLEIFGPEAERFVSDILDLDYWGPRFEVIPKNVPFEGAGETVLVDAKEFQITSIPARHSVPAVAYCFKEKDTWNVDIKKAEKKYGLKQGRMVGKLKKLGKIEFKGKKIRLKDVGYVKPGPKFVYTGDTKPSPNILKMAKGADVLLHDATFGEEFEKAADRAHTKISDAAQTAKKAGVKKLLLTHFSRRYVDLGPLEKEAKKVFKNSEAAKDFMRIELK